MLKSKIELEQYLEKKIFTIVSDKETCREICDYNKGAYDIPRGMTLDYISLRTPLAEASEFILFCLLDSIAKATNKNCDKLEEFFTQKEIKTYSSAKFKLDKIKFPIKFKVIQIADDQWIGKIDFKMLMKLREAQLVNYNENAQRTMQRIIRGDTEVYKITVNDYAVTSIRELYENETYIPTPLTLNIPLDSDSDFYYDEDTNELIVRSLEHFDITDGYHRYLAACQVCDFQKNFNYQMELRIVNFSDEKAKQFIYQEDQKTKMKKVDSNSLNMTRAANIVTNRINESSQCNMQGLISRNQGVINFAYLSSLINYLYFKDVRKEEERSVIINTSKDLIDSFNIITEHNEYYLEKYSYKKLVLVMYCFYYFRDKDKTTMSKVIDEVIKRAENIDARKFYTKDRVKKSMINDVEKVLKEVLEYV